MNSLFGLTYVQLARLEFFPEVTASRRAGIGAFCQA